MTIKTFGTIKVRGEDRPTIFTFSSIKKYDEARWAIRRAGYEITDSFWGYQMNADPDEVIHQLDALHAPKKDRRVEADDA